MKTADDKNLSWPGYQKVGFRFAFLFFLLFIILFDWSANPVFSWMYYYGYLSSLLDGLVSWTGSAFFGITDAIVSPYDAEHNDRTYVYLLFFLISLLAAVGTLVWSWLDRRRSHYSVLYYWFTAIVRYYLAFTMFLFGLYKFFRVQFPNLSYYTLSETVGDMSPMHLAWAFFGYSHGYNVFMGLAECAGLLMLFRRTTTFGALLTMAALANVIAVNYSFDVHAKMYPTGLFLMALLLVLKDAKRIGQFFFTGQVTSLPAIKVPVFEKGWMNPAKTALKVLVIAYFLYGHIANNIGYQQSYQESLSVASEYAGLYEIESFVLETDTLPKEDPQRWHQLILGDRMLEAVRFAGDSVAFVTTNPYSKELIISGSPTQLAIDRQEIYNELGVSDETYYSMDSILIARHLVSHFQLQLIDPSTLLLKGRLRSDSAHIIAKKQPLELPELRLMNRDFHWINEASYMY